MKSAINTLESSLLPISDKEEKDLAIFKVIVGERSFGGLTKEEGEVLKLMTMAKLKNIASFHNV